MSSASAIERAWRRRLQRPALAGLLAVTFLAAPAAAAQKSKAAPGPVVARCTSVAGTLLQREAGGSWRPVKAGATLRAGSLLVAFPRAEILSQNGAVKLELLADIGQRGPLPVLESAVGLTSANDADLELTFDRGLIALTNVRKKGPAKVRIRLDGATWELTLREPGARVGVERYGRHPPGEVKWLKKKVEPPTGEVYLLVIKGKAFLDVGPKGFGLSAPPGNAGVHWDNVSREPEVRRLEKLPEAVGPLDDKGSRVYKEICDCAHHLAAKDLGKALDGMMKSEKKMDRLLGVTAAGGVDDLPRVLAGLSDPKHADLRDHTVLVLRNWIGRGPGQVEKLYAALRKAKFSEVQANSVLRLLFGFTEEEQAAPVTYELLIHYLKHSKLPVRELARWHLFRLVPAGRDIPYDAAAPAAERQRAFEAWRALIPEGKLPPPPKKVPTTK
jgi:hypothetical protein